MGPGSLICAGWGPPVNCRFGMWSYMIGMRCTHFPLACGSPVALCPACGQGFFYRLMGLNRRPPVMVNRSGLTGYQ